MIKKNCLPEKKSPAQQNANEIKYIYNLKNKMIVSNASLSLNNMSENLIYLSKIVLREKKKEFCSYLLRTRISGIETGWEGVKEKQE